MVGKLMRLLCMPVPCVQVSLVLVQPDPKTKQDEVSIALGGVFHKVIMCHLFVSDVQRGFQFLRAAIK